MTINSPATLHAEGIAETNSWDEKPYQEFEDGRKLTKATVVQTLTGGISGEVSTEYVMAYTSESYASYVGMALMKGTLGDKQGTFLLRLVGTFEGGIASGTWSVVSGSGTGALKALQGEGGFRAPHGTQMDYTLDYAFE